jgi:hypothetical protein
VVVATTGSGPAVPSSRVTVSVTRTPTTTPRPTRAMARPPEDFGELARGPDVASGSISISIGSPSNRFAVRLTLLVVADKVRIDDVRTMGGQGGDAARRTDRRPIDSVVLIPHLPIMTAPWLALGSPPA